MDVYFLDAFEKERQKCRSFIYFLSFFYKSGEENNIKG